MPFDIFCRFAFILFILLKLSPFALYLKCTVSPNSEVVLDINKCTVRIKGHLFWVEWDTCT